MKMGQHKGSRSQQKHESCLQEHKTAVGDMLVITGPVELRCAAAWTVRQLWPTADAAAGLVQMLLIMILLVLAGAGTVCAIGAQQLW
jgi:hypothetical protein